MAFIEDFTGVVSIKTSQAEFSLADLLSCEVRYINDSKVQVILNHKIYLIHLEEVSPDLLHYRLRLGHERIGADLIRNIDRLVQNMGLSQSLASWVEDLKAPMPGLVKKILVGEQEHVQAGQNLLLLEAMKMENIIKSPQSGKIKRIAVQERQTVDKGQLLITFE